VHKMREKGIKRVFFLTGGWVAMERMVRGELPEPEGMPSVYLPWVRFRERGYSVDVFYLNNFESEGTVTFRGCRIHRVKRPRFFEWRNRQRRFRLRFPFDGVLLYLAAARYAKYMGTPDVVYAMQPWPAFPAWAIGRKCGATIVKRVYGTWLTQDWFHATTLRQKLLCLPHFAAWIWPFDLMVISNDGTEGDRVARLLRIPDRKVMMCMNGVDKTWSADGKRSTWLRKELGYDSSHFVLMTLSRLTQWKRQDRVLRAMPAIISAVPNARLLLVGDGMMRQSLETLASELKLTHVVQFMGMVPHSRVREMQSVADVFLQTNDLSCLGNSLLEAVVCGRAIVTWNVGRTCDLIKHGINGILLPDAEPETLAEAVISLARCPAKLTALQQGARDYAERQLQSWDERLDMEIDRIERLRNNRS
jgi:glycosyltransferase involved in cell wall biosynthesis